jgi:glucose/arabinose dehydrogenase
VFRLDPTTGKSTVFASGFTNIGDIAFGADGSLYVLDLSTNGLASQTGPGSGALIRVDSSGKRTTLLDQGLFLPTGLVAGPDDALYISNLGTSPGGGQVLRLSLAAVPEASTTVSLGVLLALGLGGLLAARRKKRAVRH